MTEKRCQFRNWYVEGDKENPRPTLTNRGWGTQGYLRIFRAGHPPGPWDIAPSNDSNPPRPSSESPNALYSPCAHPILNRARISATQMVWTPIPQVEECQVVAAAVFDCWVWKLSRRCPGTVESWNLIHYRVGRISSCRCRIRTVCPSLGRFPKPR